MSDTEYKECYLCHRNGYGDPLERHHVFGAANRKKSEKYGLVVYLCGERCHRNGKESVHQCRKTALKLKREFQEKAMREQGWTKDEFRQVFGRNYLD